MKLSPAIFVLLSLLLISFTVFANEPLEEESLPIGLTAEEMTRLDEIGQDHQTTAPPFGEIRNPAEWEPSQGVIIRYPLGISIAIVAEMSEDLMVTTVVSSSSYSTCYNSYVSGGVNMDNTEFIIASTNTYWTRDYGPWFIFNNGRMGIVDPIYNRPRPQDDVIPQVLGSEWGMSVYGMDLATPGGNHMSDGLGMSMSTRLVYDENTGYTHDEVDSIMMAYLNNDYEVLSYIESGGIHHIDCWAKFLNPTTIMVKDVPSSSSSYALLNARADYLSQQISAWGQPYTIVRIYCPYGTAYTNSIILNDKVLVPIFNNGEDNNALQTYSDAMPGYEILGYTGSWLDDDAIHCRAMGVPDQDMLFIHHIPVVGSFNPNDNVPISVQIDPYSDLPLISDSLKIIYSVDGGLWQYALLSSTAVSDSFYGEIPAQPGASEVAYYIQAADESERVENHPYIGAPMAHKYNLNTAPIITAPDSFLVQGDTYFSFYPDCYDPDDITHTVEYTNYPGWLSSLNDTLDGTAAYERIDTGFDVEVSDSFSSATQHVKLVVFKCGDADDNGDDPNVVDLVFLVDFLFKGGEAPFILESGNVDGIDGPGGLIDVADLTYYVDYIFKGGDPLICLQVSK